MLRLGIAAHSSLVYEEGEHQTVLASAPQATRVALFGLMGSKRKMVS